MAFNNFYGTILVAGCGGTGTQVLKILLQKNYSKITLIDKDTVSISNLNRQFFYTKNDVGKYKSEALANKINNPKIDYLVGDIENLVGRYNLIFCCLDNVSGRMALNLIDFDVLIDCGVENNLCHVKKVIKNQNACLYCIKDLYTIDSYVAPCSAKNIDDLSKRGDILRYLIERYDDVDALQKFNELCTSKKFKSTDMLEIDSIRNSIISNVCYINSICASMAFILLDNEEDFCYIYFNGFEFTKLKIERDPNCIVCN
ncbi:hypothetical protein EDEG_00903 [Edhazardia aedis USNM 41457]|uniref:THIF-type NAD/FAD binding fold domain-containing protein n=1 Tax=Edhazardia aedis (strain USNM 41457) TaxID=1003232 RepID=J9DB47_EDHAE|nr:hypothetical protein EDEG_00903 [Edhazardia aedis USNM 41457]|eukprot:EJW04986.1 hypothetical protein EDEG_00903 [Edhazardia aedis USNM 41457]